MTRASADGDTTLLVVATVDTANGEPTAVTFSTDAGTFANNSATISAPVTGTIASVLLKAPNAPGLAVVRAFTRRNALSTTVDFIRAYPDTIFLDFSAAAIDTTQNLTVTATLHRPEGSVSPGTATEFKAWVLRADSASIGHFGAPAPSTTNGVVSVTFYAPDTLKYTGGIIISAVTRKDDGTVTAHTRATILLTPKSAPPAPATSNVGR
jgi:hypothetical protein